MNKTNVYFQIKEEYYYEEDFKYGFAINQIWLEEPQNGSPIVFVKYYTNDASKNLISGCVGDNYVLFQLPMSVENFNKIKTKLLHNTIVDTIKNLLSQCEDNVSRIRILEDVPSSIYGNEVLFKAINEYLPNNKILNKAVNTISEEKISNIEYYNNNENSLN